MAIDYGTKRTGLAVSDPLGIIATALNTVQTEHLIDYLKEYLKKENVERCIVGEPKQMNNAPSQISGHIDSFIKKLKKTFSEISILQRVENYTTHALR